MNIYTDSIECPCCAGKLYLDVASIKLAPGEYGGVFVELKVINATKKIKYFDDKSRAISTTRYARWHESYKYALANGASERLARVFASYREYRAEFSGGRKPLADMWTASERTGFRFARGKNVKRYLRFAARVLKIG